MIDRLKNSEALIRGFSLISAILEIIIKTKQAINKKNCLVSGKPENQICQHVMKTNIF